MRLRLHRPWEEHRAANDLPGPEIVQHLRGVRERPLSSHDRPETTRVGKRDCPREVGHRRRVRAEIRFATVHQVACGDVDGLPSGGDRDEPPSRTKERPPEVERRLGPDDVDGNIGYIFGTELLIRTTTYARVER